MLHKNQKEASISTITTLTTTTTTTIPIDKQNSNAENILEAGNKGIMSLTRRSTLEPNQKQQSQQQQHQISNLMVKQRAKNDEHVLATTNNNYCSNNNGNSLTATISKRKNANMKTQMMPFTQKSQKLLLQHQELSEVNNKEQQQIHAVEEEDLQKLHNNQPLIANIEHLSCQTHAFSHTHTNSHAHALTSTTIRPNLSAYSQPYATPSSYIHTTNTLSTFKGKNSCSSGGALSRHSHYFSSLDNRSQRHFQQKQQQQQQQEQQQQQQQHYIENYPHYRQKKRKQTYESLMPYSVANLPTLQMNNGSFGSSDGSNSEESNETTGTATTTTTAMPARTPIDRSGTAHYHMSHHKMHQQQQQQQQQHQYTKQISKDNHGYYISPNQAKSSCQQQQQIEITSLKQNKRNIKLQHRHLPNSQQERT